MTPKNHLYSVEIDTLEGPVHIWLNCDNDDEVYETLEKIPLVANEIKQIADLVHEEEH